MRNYTKKELLATGMEELNSMCKCGSSYNHTCHFSSSAILCMCKKEKWSFKYFIEAVPGKYAYYTITNVEENK